MQQPNSRQFTWTIATLAIGGSAYFAWTAVAALRTGTISVKNTLLGFTWWDEVNSDDEPFQFWFAVIGYFIASAACIVGLVFLVKAGIS